jgi:hypothetical protein
MSEKESVKVVMRCRPFSEKEKVGGYANCVEINKDTASVSIKNQNNSSDPAKLFTFDSVFDGNSTQVEVYNLTARRIVDAVLEGVSHR